jgi:cbb3-type cytochrome oxidase subunit 3
MALGKLVLAGYKLISLNCFAMVLFFMVFTGALLWVYRKSGKEFYKYMENLPLQGDER